MRGDLQLSFDRSAEISGHSTADPNMSNRSSNQPKVVLAALPAQFTPSSSAGEMSLVLSRNNSHNQLTNANSSQPGSRRMTGDNMLCLQDLAAAAASGISSRRPSVVLASMRRQSIGIVAQRRLLLGLLHGHTDSSNSLRNYDSHHQHSSAFPEPDEKSLRSDGGGGRKSRQRRRRSHNNANDAGDDDDNGDGEQRLANRLAGDDNLTTILSAFYAKLLVVLGIAFPVTGVLSSAQAHASFYQGFYLYLYVVSVLFVVFMYTAHLRTRALFSMIDSFHDAGGRHPATAAAAAIPLRKPVARYGSFYLRIGAIAFGIGSMVYSGLEFGQYFELNGVAGCQNVLVALTPAARTVLSIVQMQFIFLNTKEFEMFRHKVVARFGLMHMVATNLCEWLYVLVEETKHEIVHLHQGGIGGNGAQALAGDFLTPNNETLLQPHHELVRRATASHIVVECRRTNIMGRLVQNASPFLFPCTIEYSLICAVILFEMWKQIRDPEHLTVGRRLRKISALDRPSAHHFSVDCSRAHRGMFAGILVIVLTIIALIMFYVLSAVPLYAAQATLGVTVAEMGLYVLTTAALAWAYARMRDLRFVRHMASSAAGGIPLDCTLLLLAQSGCYIYGMFSIIGSYFAIVQSGGDGAAEAMVAEVFGLVQTSAQTIFILNAWNRRLVDGDARQARDMPGRETITFLLVANMAMWCVNTLVKNRAAFRPTHLRFFGAWAWTIITHVSMPLAIFYRFHSTICLFEIWKTAYKVRPAAPATVVRQQQQQQQQQSQVGKLLPGGQQPQQQQRHHQSPQSGQQQQHCGIVMADR